MTQVPRILVAALVAWLVPVHAGATEDPAYPSGLDGTEISRLVEDAAYAAGKSAAPLVASARRFPPCDHEPEVRPREGDWATVELICTAPRPWERAVRTGMPTAPVARAPEPVQRTGTPVATLRQSLSKGTVITAAHFTLEPTIEDMVRGAFVDPEILIGRRLKTNLTRGQIVLARHLEPNWLVEAGQPVAIGFMGAGMNVSMPGKALQPGQLGELIAVQNLSSGREIKGIVIERYKVAVRAKLN